MVDRPGGAARGRRRRRAAGRPGSPSSARRQAAARIESSKAFCHEVAGGRGRPDGARRRVPRPPTPLGVRRGAGRRRPGRRRQGRRAGRRQGRHGLRLARRGGDRRSTAVRRRSRRGDRPGRHRGAADRPGGEPDRALRRPRRRGPAAGPRPQAAAATATPARTPAGWVPTARLPDLPDDADRIAARRVPPADPGRARPPRNALPRRALRRADAHRRRPGPARVQRPVRRPGDAGDPAPPRDRPGPARCSRLRAASLRSVLPESVTGRRTAADAARGHGRDRPRGGRLSRTVRAPATGSTGSTRRPRAVPSSSMPGRPWIADGTVRTAGGRVLSVVGRGADLAAARGGGHGGRRPDPGAGAAASARHRVAGGASRWRAGERSPR